MTRHGDKSTTVEVYKIQTWKKVQTFTLKQCAYLFKSFFNQDASSNFYLMGKGDKMHKFDLSNNQHQMFRLKSLSAGVREKFRTHCDPASLITTEINGITTHMLEGQYVIQKYNGITKIYVWHALLKPSAAQVSE